MDWHYLFFTVIGIVCILRLLFIATGPLSSEEKISKASNWLIGLCLLAISWAVSNTIFGGMGSFWKKGKDAKNTSFFEDKTNSPKKTIPKDKEGKDLVEPVQVFDLNEKDIH